jgi:hypothetical protein
MCAAATATAADIFYSDKAGAPVIADYRLPSMEWSLKTHFTYPHSSTTIPKFSESDGFSLKRPHILVANLHSDIGEVLSCCERLVLAGLTAASMKGSVVFIISIRFNLILLSRKTVLFVI